MSRVEASPPVVSTPRRGLSAWDDQGFEQTRRARTRIQPLAGAGRALSHLHLGLRAGADLDRRRDRGRAAAVIMALIFVPHLIQDDGRLLAAYIKRVKGREASANALVFSAVDQSFHLRQQPCSGSPC